MNGVGDVARFVGLGGIAVDSDGTLYGTDANRLRKITSAAVVTTWVGGTYGMVNGVGTAASFKSPTDVCVDASKNVYVVDRDAKNVRKITPDGTTTTLAGSNTNSAGSTNGVGTAATFSGLKGIAIDANGNLYTTEDYNNRIRKITPTGTVTNFAGLNAGFLDGAGTNAKFANLRFIAMSKVSGNAYVTDQDGLVVRKITPAGAVTTLAGKLATTSSVDGVGTDATFKDLRGISVGGADDVLFVADDVLIRSITQDGTVVTVAGGNANGWADGTGAAAGFTWPTGVTRTDAGVLYVCDSGQFNIRKLS